MAGLALQARRRTARMRKAVEARKLEPAITCRIASTSCPGSPRAVDGTSMADSRRARRPTTFDQTVRLVRMGLRLVSMAWSFARSGSGGFVGMGRRQGRLQAPAGGEIALE